ncbi:MAG: apolipoprotein N-acyltransferase [Candidatus Omnitrophica bacterium]|nr:apolipoprotein N-acyltransferase [Candidatus Omnitrophota bacterium]
MVRILFLNALSAGLLILAFPQTDIWPLAWVGMVPLLCGLDGQTPARAFARAYLCGILFFAGTLYWLIHVTLPGMVLLAAYLAVYFGLFGAGYNFLAGSKTAWKPFGIAGLWTLLEFTRAHFLTGFGWASLGYSQYKNLLFIQIADLTGVYGVSFLVVLINCFLKEILELVLAQKRFGKSVLVLSLRVPVIVLVLVSGYGISRLTQLRQTTATPGVAVVPQASIAVIQANIPQSMKWYEPAWPDIMARYKILTGAAAKEKPDLIIWPETSYPGILWEDKKLFDELRGFVARLGVPLLVGSIVRENGHYYNTAILLSKDGEILQQYKKIHLVPFGEYIPLRPLFPFLEHIVPIADFTAGGEYTVFDFSQKEGAKAKGGGRSFSVLICFEDTLAGLTRQFVRQGAGLLVNMTNDAWFKDTKEPFMHAQASVFRSVENRRSLVRAANTGVSCSIDASGRMVQAVADERGKKTYVAGYAIMKVRFDRQKTFYTRYGDVFIMGCCACLLWAAVRRRRIFKR